MGIVKYFDTYTVFCGACEEELGTYDSKEEAEAAIENSDWITMDDEDNEDGTEYFCPDCGVLV